jgi:hypothetical protein
MATERAPTRKGTHIPLVMARIALTTAATMATRTIVSTDLRLNINALCRAAYTELMTPLAIINANKFQGASRSTRPRPRADESGSDGVHRNALCRRIPDQAFWWVE